MKTLNILQLGDTMHVFDDAARPTIERRVDAGLRKGETVTRQDGSRTWITETVRFDPRAEGSDRYTWDRSGNRVLSDRVLVTVTADGKRTETALKPVFKAF